MINVESQMVAQGRPHEFKVRACMTIYEEHSILQALDAIARRDGTSMQKIIRKVIREYVKAHGDDNSQFKIEGFADDPKLVALPTLGETPSARSIAGLSDDDKLLIAKNVRAWKHFLSSDIKQLDWKWEW